MQATVGILEQGPDAGLVLHPLRMQLLEQFREPASAAHVARRLQLPRQRVGHHVRLLQEHGLLCAAGERRRGNFVEQLLQTSARTYLIAPQALGHLGPDRDAVRDRFSSDYLAAAAASIIRDVARLRRLADASGKRVPTLTLETEICFRDPEAQAEFTGRLAGMLASLCREFHDPTASEGRRFRFAVAGLPAVVPPEPDAGDPDAAAH